MIVSVHVCAGNARSQPVDQPANEEPASEEGISLIVTSRVCVQLSTYADNVALPSFARHCSNRFIYPVCRAYSIRAAAAGLLLWAHAGTDGRRLYHLIDPVVHFVRAVPIIITRAGM